MHKVILMILLAVVSSSAMAEWVKVYFNHTETFYVDFASIQKEGNTMKMKSLTDFKTAQKTRNGIAYLSIIEAGKYDCKEGKVQVSASTMHSKKMGGGRTVLIDSSLLYYADWVPLAHDSIDQILWKHACGKN